MYINSKTIDRNSQSILRVISPFELQTVIIVNFKPHRLLDSSIFNYDGTEFCS
jgi:hypothetical protein